MPTISTDPTRLTYFHSPQSRGTGVLTLLKELGTEPGIDYDMHVLDQRRGQQREPAFLAINPMGKVPALLHHGALVTEQVAVYQYLAEVFPARQLGPAIGDPLRGPYLRWLAFYGSCFEPAITDRSMKREPAPQGTSPYGTFEQMWSTVAGQLATGPYILGERFSAADVLWGGALGWMSMFKLLPDDAGVQAYIARMQARPAVAWARAKDAELMAAPAARD